MNNPAMCNFENELIFGDSVAVPPNAIVTKYKPTSQIGYIGVLHGVIGRTEIDNMLKFFKASGRDNMYDVGKQGIDTKDGVGSKRVTVFDRTLARLLNQRLSNYISDMVMESYGCDESTRIFNEIPLEINISDDSCVDAKNGTYQFVSVSPLFRYMEYSEGGEHFPHYDAPYKYDEGYQTLLSGVLYLTDNHGEGGETTFIADEKNMYKDFVERDTSDWKRQAEDDEVYFSVTPSVGKILVFQHQMCHGVSEYTPKDGKKRIIVRFDIIYKKVD